MVNATFQGLSAPEAALHPGREISVVSLWGRGLWGPGQSESMGPVFRMSTAHPQPRQGQQGRAPSAGLLREEPWGPHSSCSWCPCHPSPPHLPVGEMAWPHFCWFQCVCMSVCSVVSNSVNPETVAPRARPSMGFSGQEYWSRVPGPPPGDLPRDPTWVSCLAGRSFTV